MIIRLSGFRVQRRNTTYTAQVFRTKNAMRLKDLNIKRSNFIIKKPLRKTNALCTSWTKPLVSCYL